MDVFVLLEMSFPLSPCKDLCLRCTLRYAVFISLQSRIQTYKQSFYQKKETYIIDLKNVRIIRDTLITKYKRNYLSINIASYRVYTMKYIFGKLVIW